MAATERDNMRNLFRIVGGFAMFPSFTISAAFLFDLDEHLLHIFAILPFGIFGLILFLSADRLAVRFAPDE